MKKNQVFWILVLSALLACKTLTLTAAPAPVPEIEILTEVLQQFEDCPTTTGVEVQNQVYSFSCSHSADSYCGFQ